MLVYDRPVAHFHMTAKIHYAGSIREESRASIMLQTSGVNLLRN